MRGIIALITQNKYIRVIFPLKVDGSQECFFRNTYYQVSSVSNFVYLRVNRMRTDRKSMHTVSRDEVQKLIPNAR